MYKLLFFVALLMVLLIGIATILENNATADNRVVFCCNNNFPHSPQQPHWNVHMRCGGIYGDEYDITMETCARYWSAYLDYGETDPQEMCQYLPGTPPLPDVPIPSNFWVLINDYNNPEVFWTHYHVHEYQIYRKKDNMNWVLIKSITDMATNNYIDAKITLPDGHSYLYKMRGKIYGTYSDFTEEEMPSTRSLPKEYIGKNSFNETQEQSFLLSDNYPNPFNTETIIRYQLPKECFVTLVVYNMLGKKIRTLVSEKQVIGRHTITWDGKDDNGMMVASALYLYKLNADKFNDIKKMLLLQ
ncbi:T9SS type A sorting domain-containing protein [candidate division KSB1 bacterium]|nr:T9SS type A sorting domain-containing protein [candidate division KSB1 bacterium]